MCVFPARSALQRLQEENQALRQNLSPAGVVGLSGNTVNNLNREKEEGGVEDDVEVTSQVLSGKRGPPCPSQSNESGKRHCTRPCSLDLTSHQTQTVT